MFLISGSLFLLTVVSEVACFDKAPKFIPVEKNISAVVGNLAILPCSIRDLQDYMVVWLSPRHKTLTLEDRRITEDERMSLERPYVEEWNLHLREVTMADAGTYTCQINSKPEMMVRGVQLIVQQPASIIEELSSPEEVKVKEGESVELICNVTGYPTPNVTWYRIPRNGEGARKKVGTNGGEVLMIRNVSRYCDDEYECVAFNDVPPAASRTIQVRVQFAPKVELPTKKISQKMGGYTILECLVTAYPLGLNIWVHNGVKLKKTKNKYDTDVYPEKVNQMTLNLKIQSLEPEDYGNYECVSENFLGRDSQIMTLHEYRRRTTPKTTTTTTTTTTPYRRWPNKHLHHRHNNNDNDNIHYIDNNRNGYYRKNKAGSLDSGHGSTLQQTRNQGRHQNGGSRNNDGTIQTGRSKLENSSSRCVSFGKSQVAALAVAVSMLYSLTMTR